MSNYKEATGNAWKPTKEGETLEGLYVKLETNVGQNASNMYYIETLDTHEIVRLWGTTILDSRMSEVKIGQQVLITYKGLGEKGKGGKQAPHIWKVEYKDVDLEDIARSMEKDEQIDEAVNEPEEPKRPF